MAEFDWYGLFKRRFVGAGQNSLDGLRACFEHEESFRVEVWLGLVLFCVAPFIAGSFEQWALLVAVVVVVWIVELLNSAVEATVDRIGEDYHDLAKRAKDIGSAAVMLSMLLVLVVWIPVILEKIFY